MLVPALRSTGTWCSSSHLMMPTCAMPLALPPPKATPIRGRAAWACAGPVLTAISASAVQASARWREHPRTVMAYSFILSRSRRHKETGPLTYHQIARFIPSSRSRAAVRHSPRTMTAGSGLRTHDHEIRPNCSRARSDRALTASTVPRVLVVKSAPGRAGHPRRMSTRAGASGPARRQPHNCWPAAPGPQAMRRSATPAASRARPRRQ